MESENKAMIVRIGVFSGRPNPEISLEGEPGRQLARILSESKGKEPIHPLPPAKLGEFYGYLVYTPPELAKELSVPSEFTVYRGVVTEGGAREQKCWRDLSGIEGFLYDQAVKQGHEDLLKAFNVNRPGKSD